MKKNIKKILLIFFLFLVLVLFIVLVSCIYKLSFSILFVKEFLKINFVFKDDNKKNIDLCIIYLKELVFKEKDLNKKVEYEIRVVNIESVKD